MLARPTAHLISSLGWAEVQAVIERASRRSHTVDPGAVRQAVGQGPWFRVALSPDWGTTERLSRKGALRGADLWHLASVLTLRRSLPVLLLGFGGELREAAQEEGILLPG